MHIHRSRFLLRGEVWYDAEPDQTPVDWIFYHQRSRPVPRARWRFFYTLLLDLGQTTDELQRQLHDSTAYKIRRAHTKDGVICESHRAVAPEMLDGFADIYSRFASIKGLPPLDRQFLDLLAKDGALELSTARDTAGKGLAYHVYYCSAERSCLLHGASLYQLQSDSAARNAMGRANRYLFWQDIMRHKERGLKVFDFGGWYPGTTDHARLEINRFKEGYGGRVVREYDCEQITSARGWLLLTTAGLWRPIKGGMPKRHSESQYPHLNTPSSHQDASSDHRSKALEAVATPEARLAQ
jgi:hypothetical protein